MKVRGYCSVNLLMVLSIGNKYIFSFLLCLMDLSIDASIFSLKNCQPRCTFIQYYSINILRYFHGLINELLVCRAVIFINDIDCEKIYNIRNLKEYRFFPINFFSFWSSISNKLSSPYL